MMQVPANCSYLAAENDWQVPQAVPEVETGFHSSRRYYGFLNKYTGYFMHVAHTENEINELGSNAESCDPDVRRKLRIMHEDAKWDEEHYMFVDSHRPNVKSDPTVIQGRLR